MQHQHEDIMGRVIQTGDYLVFPLPGYGHNGGMAPLGLGEVIDSTKGGVRVRYLDKYWDYKQKEIGHWETTNRPRLNHTGNPITDYRGNVMYEREWIVDRYEEMAPVLIKATGGRFFVTVRP